ncbi:MAG: VWA domain-containing protein [Deltaproteobacteria bacterium]|jgi:stress response protein SCP2|nr:VWA domain-containing protein [Deltaproteobacteria bacterium]
MARQIVRGFRGKLGDWFDLSRDITVSLSLKGPGVWDPCCFGLDAAGRLSDDRYMVFFNRLSSPDGEIVQAGDGGGCEYRVRLSALPMQVDRLAFTLSLDGEGSMRQASSVSASLSQGAETVSLDLSGNDFGDEKAVIAVEIYRKDSSWRLAAVAAGFSGGLPALLRHYGGEEISALSDVAPQAPPMPQSPFPASRSPAPAPSSPAPAPLSPVPDKVSLEKRLERDAPQLVSLAKPLKVALERHNLADTVAMVGLVLDISGSMTGRYRDGAVQDVIDKTVPLAVQFDDDGKLDLWFYGTKARKMRPVTLKNYARAVPSDWRLLKKELGGRNNEPAVMKSVMRKFRNAAMPAYVVFITDGGVNKEEEIRELLIESSRMPIFWQFVGLGGKGYGILRELDAMRGRYVDNASFFALDDFRSIADDELYSRLLGRFPLWLKEAKSKGIL